jgi:uncharacterized protein
MRRILLLCAALPMTPTTLHAQARGAAMDPAKVAVIRQILEVTKAADQMLVALEATIPAQRAGNPAIPAVFWDRFVARARERRGALLDSLIPVYDRNFTTADLTELLRFYGTPVGKRLLAATPNTARESVAVGQQWGFVIGQEIGEQLKREGLIPGAR